MATLPDALQPTTGDPRSARCVLHVEMQAGEDTLLTLFATSFLKWIKDESSCSFVREVGTPASISLDEGAREVPTPTLHVVLTWSGSTTEAVAGYESEAGGERPSFLFTYKSEAPVFGESSAAPVTTLMAAVLERTKRLGPAGRARHIPRWIPDPLVAEASRARQVLERWMDRAMDFTDALVDRRHRVATLWYSARVASLTHAQSAVRRFRTPSSAAFKPVWWAAAGLFAASAIYAVWALPDHAKTPVPRSIAAGNSVDAKPSAIERTAEKPSAVLVAAAPSTGPKPLMTSGVVRAAAVIPPAPATRGRATNASPVARVSHASGYVGSLVVTSDPQGADVSVDGVSQGRTPLAIKNVNIGSRVVRLDLPGHQRWSWAVSVAANRQTPITVRLVPAATAQ